MLNYDDYNFYFSEFRKTAIINFMKKQDFNETIVSYLVKLIKLLFDQSIEYNKINNILTNAFEISDRKNNLLSILDKFNNTNQIKTINNKYDYSNLSDKSKENSKLIQPHPIVSDLNDDNFTNRNLLELLKNFIDNHGIVNKKEHKILWIENDFEDKVMLCEHYYYTTNQLKISNNNEITTFLENFYTKYVKIQTSENQDKHIFCKYCGVKPI